MGLPNVRVLMAAAAASVLSGCVSFGIYSPADGAAVKSPPPTAVTIKASPSMSALMVTLNGTDVSNSMNSTSGTVSNGTVNVPAGTRSVLAADANVDCWYCYPRTQRLHHQVTFCVAPSSALSTFSKTAFAKRDTLSWSKTSDTTVGVAQDANTFMTQWNLVRIGGVGSSSGLIASTENTCLCMRSMDDQQNTPIGFAICDGNDNTQQWQALQIPNTGNAFRFQNMGRGVSSSCLTEGPNNVLIQRDCNDTPDQLWTVKDLTSGQFGSPF